MLVNDLGGDENGGGAARAPALEIVKGDPHAGGEAKATLGSVADRDAAGPMVEQAVRDFGRLDVVVKTPVPCATRSSTRLRMATGTQSSMGT